MNKESIPFGQGSFVGAAMSDEAFFEMSPEDQARTFGWADGCPVVEQLIVERGPESMASRYGEVNMWFGFIAREVRARDPALYDKLMENHHRMPNEPVGKHETESTPPEYQEMLFPMNTLPGFALPRVFIEQLGTAASLPKSEVQQRLVRGLEVLDHAITLSRTPEELLALVAEGCAQADADPKRVLYHCLGKGWVEEHSSHSTIRIVKNALIGRAPNLWQQYAAMSEIEKTAAHIV